MSRLVQAIPDVEVFLALEPEELGAKLVFLAKNVEACFHLPTLKLKYGTPKYDGNRPILETDRMQWRSP